MAGDTEYGLVVPVVRDAADKSFAEVAADIEALAERARARSLAADDLHGGTFTVSNVGGIGGTSFTPIIFHPQVAIVGLARARPELRLVDGTVNERLVLPYDHRVIDGAAAARFARRRCELFEHPMRLLFTAGG